jgi:hypothetical protein
MSDVPQALIDAIAHAIAVAEGFFVAGSRPARNHNPGDLTRDLTGKGVGVDGAYIKYGSDEDGFEALNTQVSLMFSGSHVYSPAMTILEIAQRYTTTDQDAWARIVAGHLGVDINTRLMDVPAPLA